MEDQTHNPMPEPLPEPKAVKTFPVKLLAGYWPADGSWKLDKGAEVDLPDKEAKYLIKAGLAVRNDPL